MSDETTTTETTAPVTTPEPAGDLDASEAAMAEAGRVRGADGKWLSRAQQAAGVKPAPREVPEPTEEEEPAKVEPEPKPEPAKVEPEVVKSEKLRKVLELEARAQQTVQRVEQREAEVVKFYETAKAYEAKLTEREQALTAREKAWSPAAINADPVGWMLDHDVDPDKLLQAIAAGDGRRKPKAEKDQRDETIAQLQARLDRLEKEEPQWLKQQRAQEAERAAATQREAAAKWFVSEAEAKYPAILQVLDPDEVPGKIVDLMQRAQAGGGQVDDASLLRTLEATCKAKLERITGMSAKQGAKAKGQASGGTEIQPREPESTISGALTGQRTALPGKRSRAERLKEAGELKI